MNKVIVIYENIMNYTRIYKLRVNDNDLEKIKSCHGLCLRVDEGKNLWWLHNFLKEQSPVYDSRHPPHEQINVTGYDSIVLVQSVV